MGGRITHSCRRRFREASRSWSLDLRRRVISHLWIRWIILTRGLQPSPACQRSQRPARCLGLSANCNYTTSEARGLPLRTDHPALLRQAPHTWNISPTFDRGRMTVRAGLSYNDANIYAQQYQNLNSDG